jgi:hypothetical protein
MDKLSIESIVPDHTSGQISSLLDNKFQVSVRDFMSVWLRKNPTLDTKQDCLEMISGKLSAELLAEIRFAAKLSLIAYAMPENFVSIASQFHLTNAKFVDYFAQITNDASYTAHVFANMDDIIDNKVTEIKLPEDNQIAGFYVRTPIRMWNRKHERVYRVPKWEKRDDLLKYLVIGNVNVYVMRKNLVDGFELYVLFRGTSNEFNGVPQYGVNMHNTQIYHLPDFNFETQTFYKQGSDTVPLFYFYYCNMILDVKQYIYAALEQLGVESALCKRVLVVGHSMGAGLAVTFAWISRFDKPHWWHLFQFREFAAPLCCNDTAVRILEQWVIDSQTKYKLIETINRDDIANVQYMFGGEAGFLSSLQAGTSAVLAWIVKHHSENIDATQTPIQNALRMYQLHPDAMIAMFLNSAAESQSQKVPDDKKLGFRMGQRKPESKLYGTRALHKLYQDSLNIVFCSRRFLDSEEYTGRSHVDYADLSMDVFWVPLRVYENTLYRFYSHHDLKKRNRLRIVPMFSERDLEAAIKFKEDHQANWEPSDALMDQFFA